MADITLGRFLFEFISDTSSLQEGNKEASVSSEELANKIERISISNDNLARKFTQIAQVMGQTANASEWLAAKQNRAAETNEALTEAVGGLTEKFDDFSDSQAKAREEADKNDKQRDKQERGVASFTKKLLALGAAYFSVNKMAGGFKANFSQNLEIAKFTELLDVNANAVKNWIAVLEAEGGDASDVFETFKNISIQMGEIAATGAGNPLLQAVNKLGVKIKDGDEFLDPEEILLNFSDALLSKNLDKELALYVAGQFGISDDVLRLLSQGRSQIEGLLGEQRETQFQFGDGDLERIQEFNRQLESTKKTADSLFSEISFANLDRALWTLHQIENTLNILRGRESIDVSPEAMGGAFQEFVNDQMFKFKNFVENAYPEGEHQRLLDEIKGKSGGNSPESTLKGIEPVDINNPNLSDDQKMKMLLDQERKLNTLETINNSSLNKPTAMIQQGQSGGNTFDFRGMVIQTDGNTAQEIAGDLKNAISQVLGDEFTMASETLNNSVIG